MFPLHTRFPHDARQVTHSFKQISVDYFMNNNELSADMRTLPNRFTQICQQQRSTDHHQFTHPLNSTQLRSRTNTHLYLQNVDVHLDVRVSIYERHQHHYYFSLIFFLVEKLACFRQ